MRWSLLHVTLHIIYLQSSVNIGVFIATDI